MKSKYTYVVVLALLCALCMAVFSGCGAKTSDEELIAADIDKVLGLQVSAEDIASSFREDAEFMEIMNAANVDVDAYAKSIADNFTAEVTSVKVDGTKAVAVVTVHSPDFAAMSDVLETKMEEAIGDLFADDTEEITEEELESRLMSMVGEIMLDIGNDPDCPMMTEDVEVPYVKNGGKWEMENQAATEAALAELMSVE